MKEVREEQRRSERSEGAKEVREEQRRLEMSEGDRR